MIKISVIIPVFNKDATIARALNSVFNQKERPDEIIIINDGSTDNSIQVIQQFDNEIIKLVHQSNFGVSVARNRGIENAKFDYIAFLDADDEWLPEFISTIKSLIHLYPEAIGYGTKYIIKSETNISNNINLGRLTFRGNTGIIDNYFEVSNHSAPPICSSAVCIRKKDLLDVGGFPAGVKAGEDLITWARLALKGHFAYSVTPLSIYYQSTFDKLPPPPPSYDFIGNQLVEMGRNSKGREKKELNKYISRWNKMRAALFLINGKEMQALKEISKSFWYDLSNFKAGALFFLLPMPARIRYKLLFSNKFKR